MSNQYNIGGMPVPVVIAVEAPRAASPRTEAITPATALSNRAASEEAVSEAKEVDAVASLRIDTQTSSPTQSPLIVYPVVTGANRCSIRHVFTLLVLFAFISSAALGIAFALPLVPDEVHIFSWGYIAPATALYAFLLTHAYFTDAKPQLIAFTIGIPVATALFCQIILAAVNYHYRYVYAISVASALVVCPIIEWIVLTFANSRHRCRVGGIHGRRKPSRSGSFHTLRHIKSDYAIKVASLKDVVAAAGSPALSPAGSEQPRVVQQPFSPSFLVCSLLLLGQWAVGCWLLDQYTVDRHVGRRAGVFLACYLVQGAVTSAVNHLLPQHCRGELGLVSVMFSTAILKAFVPHFETYLELFVMLGIAFCMKATLYVLLQLEEAGRMLRRRVVAICCCSMSQANAIDVSPPSPLMSPSGEADAVRVLQVRIGTTSTPDAAALSARIWVEQMFDTWFSLLYLGTLAAVSSFVEAARFSLLPIDSQAAGERLVYLLISGLFELCALALLLVMRAMTFDVGVFQAMEASIAVLVQSPLRRVAAIACALLICILAARVEVVALER